MLRWAEGVVRCAGRHDRASRVAQAARPPFADVVRSTDLVGGRGETAVHRSTEKGGQT
jgi:hypothetical protein